ncbi:MAG: hypothetical protein ABFR75_07575 [Acidobacteriota bacterium]
MKLAEYKIKEYLLENNEDFIEFHKKHQLCEHELEKISSKNDITVEDLQTEQLLKRKKLKLKDSMQKLILEFEKKED